MNKIVNMYLKQFGLIKFIAVLLVILVSSITITMIILYGLSKDHQLAELFAVTVTSNNVFIRYWLIFYYFFELFLRAGVIFLQGFLAFQIIANTFENSQILQITTYPFSRLKIYLGMILAVEVISGIILIGLHLIGFGIVMMLLKYKISRVITVFLVKDVMLDIIYVFVGLIPCVIAMIKPQVMYIVGSSVLLLVILSNVLITSLKNGNILITLSILTILGLIGIFGTVFAVEKFKQIDF